MNNKFCENSRALFSKSMNPRVLIASHRGRFGGYIPENTIESCEVALKYGADILEVDVSRTKDGALVMMHGPKVEKTTNGHGIVSELYFKDIQELKFLSAIKQVTDKSINTLDEFLSHFKDRCLINLDRCWDYMDEVFELVKHNDMVDQIILKSPKPVLHSFKWLESQDFQPIFMPIITEYEELIKLIAEKNKGRIPAVELVFDRDDSKLVAHETIQLLHDNNFKVWMNSITLDKFLAGGHDDTISILGREDEGWGWLLNRGADIIQTDWVMELDYYLTSKGRR